MWDSGIGEEIREQFARLEGVPEYHNPDFWSGMSVDDRGAEKRKTSLVYYYANRSAVLAKQRAYRRTARAKLLDKSARRRRANRD